LCSIYGNEMQSIHFQSNSGYAAGVTSPVANSVDENAYLTLDDICSICHLPEVEILGLFRKGLIPGFQSFVSDVQFYFTPDAPKILKMNLNSMTHKFSQQELFNSSSHPSLRAQDHTNGLRHNISEMQFSENSYEVTKVASQTGYFDTQKKQIEEDKGVFEKAKPTLHLNQQHFLNNTIKKIEQYCRTIDNYSTSELLKSVRGKITGEDLQQIPDYVDILSLDIKLVTASSPTSGYRLDLRNEDVSTKKVRNILGGKRIRLEGTNIFEAKEAANIKIQHKCNESNIELIAQEFNGNLNQALKITYKKNMISQKKTIHEMEQYLLFWQFVAGDVPLEFIDTDFVVEVVAKLFSEGKKPSTVHHFCTELRKTMDNALHRKWINYVPKIPSFQSEHRNFIDIPEEKFTVFKNTYIQLQNNQNSHHDFVDGTFIDLLRYSGMRLANTENTSVNDIDLKRKLLRIPKSVSKADIDMDIPLSNKALDAINGLLLYRQKVGITHPSLFAKCNEGKTVKVNKKAWKTALIKADLPENLVRHHFRHYFITTLIREGSSYENARIAGGYKSMASMLRYIHCGATDAVFDAVNKIE
jgi:integrase